LHRTAVRGSELESLSAGKQLSLAGPDHAAVVHAVEPHAVAGWREGRLQYLGESLASVVSDVNRYSFRKIEIANPAVAALRVTGTIYTSDTASWIKSLEAALPVHI